MLARLAGATARGVAGPRGACAAVRRIKTTTGIVGLDVEPEAKSILEDLYAKTLTALEALPADAEYRSVVEALTKERLAVVKGTSDLDKIEATLGAGQARRPSRSPLPLTPPLPRCAPPVYEARPVGWRARHRRSSKSSSRRETSWSSFQSSPRRACGSPTTARPPPRRSTPTSKGAQSATAAPPPLPSRSRVHPPPRRRRGIALQRHDIPMRQSVDYPTAEAVDLIPPAPPAEEEKK